MLAEIKAALAEYGAALDEKGFLVKNGRTFSVRAICIRSRLRFEGVSGRLIASGPMTATFVRSFVESYYFWEKPKCY